jgi:hypothetical protein
MLEEHLFRLESGGFLDIVKRGYAWGADHPRYPESMRFARKGRARVEGLGLLRSS